MRLKALESGGSTDAHRSAEGERSARPSQDPWIRHAVREIQEGRDLDHVQFGLIYKHYEPRCTRLLKSFGLRREVEDLVQEVMWRVYRGISDFRCEASFDTWLSQIVKNTARNAIRDRNTKKARVGEASLDAMLDHETEEGSARREPVDRGPGPLEVTLGKEREAELDALLQELPPRMRQSMLLYYVHGFKQSEIAVLQGTTVNTVKKQLVDGRKRVRPLFGIFAELFSLLSAVFLFVGLSERL